MPRAIITRSTARVGKLVVTKDETKARAAWLLATLTIRRRVAFGLNIINALDAAKNLRVRKAVSVKSEYLRAQSQKDDTPREHHESAARARSRAIGVKIKQEEDDESEQEDEDASFSIQSWVQLQPPSARRPKHGYDFLDNSLKNLPSRRECQEPRAVFAWNFGKAALPNKRNGR
jgi:hypothetical protein